MLVAMSDSYRFAPKSPKAFFVFITLFALIIFILYVPLATHYSSSVSINYLTTFCNSDETTAINRRFGATNFRILLSQYDSPPLYADGTRFNDLLTFHLPQFRFSDEEHRTISQCLPVCALDTANANFQLPFCMPDNEDNAHITFFLTSSTMQQVLPLFRLLAYRRQTASRLALLIRERMPVFFALYQYHSRLANEFILPLLTDQSESSIGASVRFGYIHRAYYEFQSDELLIEALGWTLDALLEHSKSGVCVCPSMASIRLLDDQMIDEIDQLRMKLYRSGQLQPISESAEHKTAIIQVDKNAHRVVWSWYTMMIEWS